MDRRGVGLNPHGPAAVDSERASRVDVIGPLLMRVHAMIRKILLLSASTLLAMLLGEGVMRLAHRA
jgi:hypothetical protein